MSREEEKEFAKAIMPKATAELQADPSEVLDNPPIVPMGNPYLLVFINRSDRCFARIRTKNVNQPNWGNFWMLPTTCRTCSLATLPDCYNQKKWSNLLITDCDSVDFEVEIATMPDKDGKYFVVQYDAVTPNCAFSGGVLGFEE